MYTPQSREYYISCCRYYNGEKEAPDNQFDLQWDYERVWVNRHFSDEGHDYLKGCVQEYKAVGLGSFMADDGTPIGIKAILWNRYENWSWGSPESFRVWYKRFYLRALPTHAEAPDVKGI